jgi:hypothetical protein
VITRIERIGSQKVWEVTDTGNFRRLGRSRGSRVSGGRKSWGLRRLKIIIGQECRLIWEVKRSEKFGRLWRSGNLGDLVVWKNSRAGKIGRILSPLMNAYL